jgi:hypothetical protein
MKRFDFLRDGERALPETLRAAFASSAMRAPLICAGGIFAAIGIAVAAETYALDAAAHAAQNYEARYATARAAGDAVERVQRQALRSSENADRVRWLRGSGTRVAGGLARVANALPAHAWLTAIDRVPGGYTLSGAAADPAAIAGMFGAFETQFPVLVRVDGAAGSQPARFTLTIEASP